MTYATRRNDMSDLEAATVRGGFTGLSAWLELAVQRARQYAPVDTGRLARSINQDPMGPTEIEPMIFTGLFGSNVEYARAHELGSGIHALDPSARELILIEAGYWTGKSDKKALNFVWPSGPKDHPAYNKDGPYAGTFTFRRVYHPGVPPYKGRGYLRPAAHDSAEVGKRLVLAAITAEWRKL